MAIRGDVTVDWESSPRIITVMAPSTEITMQDLVDTCRSLEDNGVNMDDPHLISAAGKESLGGGVYVGITVTLQNAKLAFEARGGPSFVQCQVSGGNLVAVDSVGGEMDPIQTTAYVQVVRTSSSSATLQELLDIQFASFNGGVTVDITSSYTGTTYPTGTPRQPVNNLTDAMAIANERGFTTLYIIGNVTVDESGDYHGIIFVGESTVKSIITVQPAANVQDAEFYEANVVGTLDGNAKLKDCLVNDLNYIYGIMESCILGSGTISLGGSEPAHFLDCWSGVAGTSTPVIDMAGSGQNLSIRNYNGGITVMNKTGSDAVSIDLNSGHVKLSSTVTVWKDGEIVIRGVGKLTNSATNPGYVQADWLLQGDQFVKTRKMIYNDVEISGDLAILKDDDGSVWKVFDLTLIGNLTQRIQQ